MSIRAESRLGFTIEATFSEYSYKAGFSIFWSLPILTLTTLTLLYETMENQHPLQ